MTEPAAAAPRLASAAGTSGKPFSAVLTSADASSAPHAQPSSRPNPDSAAVGMTLAAQRASPPADPASSQRPQSTVAALIARGDELLANGDVTSARLLYMRAVGFDSSLAAIAMGMTYDSRFLERIRVRGIPAEPQRAASWYQQAADMGSTDATRLLAQVQKPAKK